MPPSGGTRTSLVDEQGRPLVLTGQALGPAVTNSDFSPGQPIAPVREEPVRVWDFPVSVNTQIPPRPASPFGFAHLRAFANVEPVRLAIETRKDQIERLDWKVKAVDEKAARKDATAAARIARIAKLLKKPDGMTPFATWLRPALEDLLALDASAFEKRRNRGGELIGLDVVPGDTIKLLVDETGRRPLPPYPAYQQIIKGRVWANLTSDDLLYSPRNRRPNHVMGFSPVEQIIVTIQTVINRQTGPLAYGTEGNTPAAAAEGRVRRMALPHRRVRLLASADAVHQADEPVDVRQRSGPRPRGRPGTPEAVDRAPHHGSDPGRLRRRRPRIRMG
jgi:hypothetical protein